MNHCHLKKYSEHFKTHNVFIIQLKINKIEFNKFLHERRILDVMTAHCQYNENYMTIKHILFFIQNKEKKEEKCYKRRKSRT